MSSKVQKASQIKGVESESEEEVLQDEEEEVQDVPEKNITFKDLVSYSGE